jgi:hypothetical protein
MTFTSRLTWHHTNERRFWSSSPGEFRRRGDLLPLSDDPFTPVLPRVLQAVQC